MSPAVLIALVLGIATIFLMRQRMGSRFVDAGRAHHRATSTAPATSRSTRSGVEPRTSVERTHPVVVYCRSGMRSAQAKRTLEAAGFTQVYNLGGMSRW